MGRCYKAYSNTKMKEEKMNEMKITNFFSRLDVESCNKKATDLSESELQTAKTNNKINMALGVFNCIPGIQYVSGAGSILLGSFKIFFSWACRASNDASTGEAISYSASGMKNIAMGAAVFLLPPGINSLANAAIVGKDGFDVFNLCTRDG